MTTPTKLTRFTTATMIAGLLVAGIATTTSAAATAAEPAARPAAAAISTVAVNQASAIAIVPTAIPVSSIIRGLQKAGPAVYGNAVRAARAGWPTFQTWWNKLPRAVRWVISQATQASAWEIFNALRHML